MSTAVTLIADIGGTNARFALSPQAGVLDRVQVLATRDFDTIESAIESYLTRCGVPCNKAVIAIAGPLNKDPMQMTNCHWSVSKKSLSKRFFHQGVQLINDFEANALLIPYLNDQQRITIGPAPKKPINPCVVIGPGTGLGVALAIPGEPWQTLATEGGHCGLAPHNALELAIFEYWLSRNATITRELFLSGQGLVNIYKAISAINGENYPHNNPKDIQEAACNNNDPNAVQSLHVFCELLATAACDQVVSAGAWGGVYLAGGMISHFQQFFLDSNFRDRFDNLVMPALLKEVPCYLITAEQPGLLGASYLNVT